MKKKDNIDLTHTGKCFHELGTDLLKGTYVNVKICLVYVGVNLYLITALHTKMGIELKCFLKKNVSTLEIALLHHDVMPRKA